MLFNMEIIQILFMIISYTVLYFLIIYIYSQLSNYNLSINKNIIVSLISGIVLYLQLILEINSNILIQFLFRFLFLIVILMILNKNNIFQIIYYSTTINALYLIIYISIFYLSTIKIEGLFFNLIFIDYLAVFGTVIIYLILCHLKLIKFKMTTNKYGGYLIIINFLSSLIIPCLFLINENPATWSFFYFFMLFVIFVIIILCMYFLNKLIDMEKKLIINESYSRYKTMINIFSKNINHEKKEARKLRHDSKKHFILIKELLISNQLDEAINYLDKIHISGFKNMNSYTNNIVLDAYLNYVIDNNQNINFEIKSLNLNNFDNDNLDYIILITNIIDNAIENISIPYNLKAFFKFEEEKIILKVINNTLINPINTGFKSNKKENGHGLGMMIITDIVNKYNGDIIYSYEDKVFSVYVELDIVTKGKSNESE